jgi:hypothetical protein
MTIADRGLSTVRIEAPVLNTVYIAVALVPSSTAPVTMTATL